MKKKLGIYIHIPFCERKCYYCGFLSFDDWDKGAQEQYISDLLKEIELTGREHAHHYQCDSVFIGGGTPSLLGVGEISRVMDKVVHCFPIEKGAEVSIESNPNSLTRDKLREYGNAGINRLSIGIQSLRNDILYRMGRVHKREDAIRAYENGRKAGFHNINLDLMFGVPGQSFSSWKEDLSEIISMEPDHLSLYSIQLEEDTPYYDRYKRGELNFPPEAEDRKMFHHAIHELKGAGYDHYEISNFGKIRCRHNLKYWSLEDYLGVGLGASSYMDGKRSKNTSDFDQWSRSILEGNRPVDEDGFREETREEAMSIYCFTGLRKTRGIDMKEFEHRFGTKFSTYYREKLPYLIQYQEEGLLVMDEGRLALTEAGIDVSNEIMSEFV